MASFRATRHGLRITGELDMANRDRFIRTVSARLTAIPQLFVDVTGLEFIDAGTLGELDRIAAGLPPEGRITITGASRQLRRLASFLGAWPHPQLTIKPAVSNDRDRVVGTGVET
jgi:ABC-type transporter Mla MlaB component